MVIFIEFVICHSLAFDIFGDGILIAMLSNSASEVTVCPEFASPQLLFHFQTTPEHFSCGNALYHRYDLGYALCWNGLHQEMHMIPICTNLQEFHLISFFYVQKYFLHDIIQMIIKYCKPIVCGRYQIIYQYRYIMRFMDVFRSHSYIMPKPAGNTTLRDLSCTPTAVNGQNKTSDVI